LGRSTTASVYDVRPIICRVFGMTPGLRCRHGCVPDGLIADSEVVRVLLEIEELSVQVTGVRRGPRRYERQNCDGRHAAT
jgi:hypothetical protein